MTADERELRLWWHVYLIGGKPRADAPPGGAGPHPQAALDSLLEDIEARAECLADARRIVREHSDSRP